MQVGKSMLLPVLFAFFSWPSAFAQAASETSNLGKLPSQYRIILGTFRDIFTTTSLSSDVPADSIKLVEILKDDTCLATKVQELDTQMQANQPLWNLMTQLQRRGMYAVVEVNAGTYRPIPVWDSDKMNSWWDVNLKVRLHDEKVRSWSMGIVTMDNTELCRLPLLNKDGKPAFVKSTAWADGVLQSIDQSNNDMDDAAARPETPRRKRRAIQTSY